MSKTDETFIPAFPFEFKDQSGSEFDGEQFADMGMSLRDYFAAHALQVVAAKLKDIYPNESSESYCQRMAHGAYAVADAMLEEREK